MNTNRIAKAKGCLQLSALILSILTAIVGGNALAAAKTQQSAVATVDSAKTRNKHQLTQHSARKAAAKRLKVVHQKLHQQKLDKWINSHHGYTGFGRRG